MSIESKKFNDSKLDGKSRRKVLRQARRRGAMMLEAVLAVGVATAMIGVTTAIISSEHDKQTAKLLGNEGSVVIEAARMFVAQNYAELQTELYEEARSGGGNAIFELSAADLVERGYLTPAFEESGVLNKLHGQEYHLLIRAVDRADGGTPQTTLTRADLDPGNNGYIDPAMTDRDPANGEMDIEAVLVTSGGDPMRSGMAGNVIQGYDSPYAGFVNRSGTADGLYGSFSLSLAPYSGLSGYPTEGRFASVVALSNYGVLGANNLNEGIVPGALDRCDGLDTTSTEYLNCLANNNMYTDIVFNPADTDGDGNVDKYPAIRGLSMVQCIQDADENTTADLFLIDCATTRVTGNLDVRGNDNTIGQLATTEDTVTFAGAGFLQRQEIGGVDKNVIMTNRTMMMDVNGGQDLAEAIVDSRVVFAGMDVEKPHCPTHSIGGFPMLPRIYVTPAAYSDPEGRAIIGVRAFAEDKDSTTWTVRLMAFVGQDFCTNSTSDPISFPYTLASTGNANAPSGAPVHSQCSTFAPDGTIMIDRSDDQSDVYELNADAGAVLVQTRCY